MPRPLRSELFLPHEFLFAMSCNAVCGGCIWRAWMTKQVKISPIDANGFVSDLRTRLCLCDRCADLCDSFQSLARRDSESSRCRENMVG